MTHQMFCSSCRLDRNPKKPTLCVRSDINYARIAWTRPKSAVAAEIGVWRDCAAIKFGHDVGMWKLENHPTNPTCSSSTSAAPMKTMPGRDIAFFSLCARAPRSTHISNGACFVEKPPSSIFMFQNLSSKDLMSARDINSFYSSYSSTLLLVLYQYHGCARILKHDTRVIMSENGGSQLRNMLCPFRLVETLLAGAR